MIRPLLVATVVAALGLPASAVQAADGRPPFESVELERIDLPSEIVDASQPAYTADGTHLLFMANATTGDADMWIVGEHGDHPRNLTGGVTGEPPMPNPGELEQPALIVPFPDGKRVFFGPYGDPHVLECLPSIVNCQSKQIFDVDLSGARPAGPIPPGGAAGGPALNLGLGARPQLSPDGKWVMFSDIRTDSIEDMILAKLTRGASGYSTSDGVVLNPPGPASPTDQDTKAWSDSTALFESKTFDDGGRTVTYVQVGGEAGGNPDVWKLDLKTGERTRLTANPDWQEDHGASPDGQWDVNTIDARGAHYLDYLSLMPYRSFFDAWEIAPVAQVAVAGAQRRSCAPFASRLLPASGDMGGALMGQVLQPYDGGDVRPSGNYQGPGMWKPDGTAVALSTQSFSTLGGAPYLEVAHFPARRPTKPLPISSSEPGDWAPAHTAYHGGLAANTDITLHGLASGTVTLHYKQNFLTAVDNTATYVNYSDDGKSFLNGTDSVQRSGTSSGGGSTRVASDLRLSGAHNGSLVRDITYVVGGSPEIRGTSIVVYDGVTHEGIENQSDRCQKIRQRLPGKDHLDVTAERIRDAKVKVTVAAGFPGAGLDEQGEDRRPVRGATVTGAGRTATTDDHGVAILNVGRAHTSLTVAAGDTFEPSSVAVGGPADSKRCKLASAMLARAQERLQMLTRRHASRHAIAVATLHVNAAKRVVDRVC